MYMLRTYMHTYKNAQIDANRTYSFCCKTLVSLEAVKHSNVNSLV